MAERTFTDEALVEIVAWVRARLAAGDRSVALDVPDPDLGAGRYPGERLEAHGTPVRHRPLRVWVDLADRLALRISTPRQTSAGRVRFELTPLAETSAWVRDREDPRRTYDPGTGFERVAKAEDPSFVLDLEDALERARLPPAPRVLSLGVNTGDELALLLALRPAWRDRARFVGVDHSEAAISVARERFAPPHAFHAADINELGALELGEFDLVLSLGTLHSPGVDDRAVLRQIVQRHLAPAGSAVFGIPNCRWRDGELLHGARMVNFRQPELSLAVRELAFYRRYLHQHHRKCFVTGKHYLLLTAIPDRPGTRDPAPNDGAPSRPTGRS